MSKNKQSGDAGELEVCDLVPCPNCQKPLMTLSKNHPFVDGNKRTGVHAFVC